MRNNGLRKLALGAAAAALSLGAIAPASASGYRGHHGGGRVVVHQSFGHGNYAPRHRYYGGGHRGGYYRGHRGGLSGGEAAVIAAAIIGGAILIDAASDRDRYDDRYAYAPPRRYAPAPRDDYYYRRDDRSVAPSYDDEGEDDFGGELLGGEGAGASYNYGAAYNDCKAETRAAADEGGLFVALPARPQAITPIDDGGAVRFTADLVAQDRNGGQFRKTMVCEADLTGVRFLELV